MGIAIWPDDGMDLTTLARKADAAMYEAKRLGRNNFRYYQSEQNASALERLTLEAGLRSAVENDEIEAVYQPQIDCRSGEIVALDDFGTGYSSLKHLLDFPVDIVKLDRSFICDIDSSEHSFKLVSVIIGMVQKLGLKTVAEGLENKCQVERA